MQRRSGNTEYAKPWDAGMDICAAEDVIIRPGENGNSSDRA